MDFTWIVVSLPGWALALVFVLVLMRMAGQQDRAARHGQKKLDPFSGVTITKVEDRRFTTAYGGESSNKKKLETVAAPNGAPRNRGSQGSAPK